MKAYFFAFFFVFFTFFLATFFTFFFATFGMSKDSFYVRPGRATHAAPQNANNMSGLRNRLQYSPSDPPKAVLLTRHKTSYFAVLFALRLFTDDFWAKPRIHGPIACKCANHPSSGNPSRALRIAFTTAGFAFPPVAFIT
jgi:hypothetical protein